MRGSRLEESELGAGVPEPVSEVGRYFIAGKRGQVIADDDALGEGFVHSHGKPAPEFRLTQ